MKRAPRGALPGVSGQSRLAPIAALLMMLAAALSPNQTLHAATPCSGGLAAGFPCDDINLRSFVTRATLGSQNLNDCWGWTDPVTGAEIALVCTRHGTAFVDISNPDAPVYIGRLPTHTINSLWRDVKVYRDHAYIVSEAPGHGMQVFDLNQLRSVVTMPAVFSETAFYGNFGNSHNIAINEDTGFAYSIGTNTCAGGLHMIDIRSPAAPTFAGCFSTDGYTHDVQVVVYRGPDIAHQGREIAFACNEDTVTIVDVTNKSAPVMRSRAVYPGSGYSHQGWLTEDQRYFILGDELDERTYGHNTRIRVWDVADLESPFVATSVYLPTQAIEHNIYVRGKFVYVSNYRAGVRILDIPVLVAGGAAEVGFFDIYPPDNLPEFNGAWSVYPYFDSGIFIVSGIEQGLFVLESAPALITSRCVFVSPLAGALIAGDAPILWKGLDPEGAPLTTSFAFSSDGGLTFSPATAAASSPAANPDIGRPTPFTAASFVWDTRADGLGLGGREYVHLRATINDGTSLTDCAQIYQVNNVPECVIASPGAGAGITGVTAINFSAQQPIGDPLTSTIEFSTNGGATYSLATAAPGSPTINPDPLRPTPFAGRIFLWNTQADGVGLLGVQSVALRITVDDGVISSSCQHTFDAINRPFCNIASPAPGIMVAGDLNVSFNAFDPSADILIARFEHSTDGGISWISSTPAASSAIGNPDIPRAPPLAGLVFTWDTVADGIGQGGPQIVDFRVVVQDPYTSGACNLGLLIVENAPTCALDSPLAGATVAASVPLVFQIDDPTSDPVTSSFEHSTDGGLTFRSSTAAPASPLANPDPLRATPALGLMFIWNAQADGVGYPTPQSTIVRVTVDDGALTSTCGHVVMVDNAPGCAIATPLSGAMVTDRVAIIFGGSDPSSDPVTSTIEFSTDMGTTYALATAGAGSTISNPDLSRPTPFLGLAFEWDSVADAVGLASPQNVIVRVSVNDGFGLTNCTTSIVVANNPECMATWPVPTATETGEITIRFNASDPSTDPLTSSFSFSTDAGASYTPATASPSSPITNPDNGRPSPFVDLVFLWDSVADGIGLSAPANTLFRIAISDGIASSECLDSFVVNNVPPPPTCSIVMPVGTFSGAIAFTTDYDSPSTAIIGALIEHSTDGGMSWIASTMAAASPTANPVAGITVGPRSCIWDSSADMVGLVGAVPVLVRASVDDGVSPTAGRCADVVTVSNPATCLNLCGDCNLNAVGPDILDSLEAARIAVALVAPSAAQRVCCDVNTSASVDVVDALLIAQSAAGLTVVLDCP